NGGCNCGSIIASPTSRQGSPDENGNNAPSGNAIRVEAVPNPASDFVDFNLYGFENAQKETLEITIHDITGREVARKSVNTESKVTFDVNSLSSGMYIYKVTGKGELFYSGKIMIDRK
ncbi:MAG: T9SS type A sorting domain-containing protein, partial [Bacteroidia bacterium]|nr:T9SS type A sorting domain-containing protein [Bacteroidia bacterium]